MPSVIRSSASPFIAMKSSAEVDDKMFENQVAIVVGAGREKGPAFAAFLASRGAIVVVSEHGNSQESERELKAAQAVVNSIKTSGGKAVFHHDENRSGSSPVEAALDSFGHLDILVHITSTKDATTFLAMADPEWRDVIDSQITYAYQCTRAAWPHFRKQKHGSVLFQAWSAGLYGREDQAHICAASHALVGLSATLAAEGKKYNILSNVITLQDREETETRTSLTNRLIVSLGALLVQPARTTESGSTFEISEGRVSKLRWERSKGVLMKTDYTLTPGAVLKFTKKILDFTDAEHATGPIDSFALLDQSKNLDSSPPAPAVCLKGQVAIITGGGAGLGRVYCHLLASLGALVAVCDVRDAPVVVQEIRAVGGQAIPITASVEDGNRVIEECVEAFGRIDIVINNAGFVRDKAFSNMTLELWDAILGVHLHGTYQISHAAWPYMVKQKSGCIINTTSVTGIYGNYGQSNYAAAKAGILGLSRALAVDGARHNIRVNAIAPAAGTAMTRTVLTEEMVQVLKPEYVAAFVAGLCDKERNAETGRLYEVGAGWFGSTRWQHSRGWEAKAGTDVTPDVVEREWDMILDFGDGKSRSPQVQGAKSEKVLRAKL